MLAAMAIAATMCIVIGVFPAVLYDLLPNQGLSYTGEVYSAYDVTHVVTQLQLLFFAALAFGLLMRTGIYPAEKRSVNLDFDWVYRRALPKFGRGCFDLLRDMFRPAQMVLRERIQSSFGGVPGFITSRAEGTSSSGTSVLFASLLLFVFLVMYYV